ncbi:MAG: hypothetical protein CBE24_00065 [bacterium TMED264]|nr:MAG: hypothetical protein CBE24_00065 [bacterium TMED264]
MYLRYLIYFSLFSSYIMGFSDFGKIRGKVTAKEDNSPLIGANISLIGTNLGAVTDINGNFTILQIQSGVYKVKFGYIGRTSQIIENIHVSAELSTLLEVSLQESIMAGDEIVVSGRRKVIQPDATSSTNYIGTEQLEILPVTEIRDAMMLQPGVFFDPIPVLSSGGRGHAGESGSGEARYTIRGGDQEEILWMIDGSRTQSLTINARDAGGSFMNINSLAIKEIQILSGGFSAKYGNAQSGVVNVIMKDGQDKFNGSIQASFSPPGQRHFGNYLYDVNTQKEFKDHMVGLFFDDSSGAYYPDTAYLFFDSTSLNFIDTKYLPNYSGEIDSIYTGEPFLDPYWMSEYRSSQIFDYRNTPDYNIIATLGGPIPFSILRTKGTFQLSGQIKQEAYSLPQPRDARNWNNINLSLAFPISQKIKLKLFGMLSNEFHGFLGNSDWLLAAKYYRGYGSIMENKSRFLSLNLTHSLSKNFFYNIKLSRYSFLFNQKPSPFTNITEPGQDYSLTLWGYMRYPNFPDEPFDKYYTIHKVKERSGDLTLNIDFNWQPKYFFNLKYGFEYNYNEINSLNDFRFTALSINEEEFQDRNLHEKINPIQFGAYTQTKLEFESMILNLGLRYDYFNPNFNWFDNFDTYNLSINPNFDVSLDPDGDQIDSNGTIKYSFDNVLLQSRSPVPSRHMLSPRIGASFPITENTVLHYNYGHFYQMPPVSRMRYFKYFRPTQLLEQLIEENRLAELENRDPNHIPSVGSNHERVIFLNIDPLPPQKTIMIEIGLKHNFRNKLFFNIVAYHRDIYSQSENVIGLFDKSYYGYNPFTGAQSNAITDTPLHGDFGDSRGLELELRSQLSEKINFNINYSFSKVMQGRASPHKVIFDSTGVPEFEWYDEYSGFAFKSLLIERQFSRPHILKFGVNYSVKNNSMPFFKNSNASLMYRYISGQTYTYLDLDDTPTTYDNHRYPGIHFTDLKLNKEVILGNLGKIKFFILIKNLMNKKNIKSMGDTSYNPNVVENFANSGLPTLNNIAGYDMSWSIWYAPRKFEFGFSYDL